MATSVQRDGSGFNEMHFLGDAHKLALVITERVTAVLSLIGILFILSTYLFSSSFNKPINRLFFFASWGNLGICIAALIAQDGINASDSSPLCQFQGFMVQMFLGVDAYWSLCMAINVYLVFFRNYTVGQLRSLDVKYLLGCYGASFIPAFVYIFVQTGGKSRIYGQAVLWCWVSRDWVVLRIALVYAIVWIAILAALVIYCMAGRVMYQKRDQLKGFLNPLNEHPFSNVVTTEINITRETRENEAGRTDGEDGEFKQYSVNVEIGQQDRPRPSMPTILRMRSLTREAAMHNETNVEGYLYARVAFLFFAVALITWIPSSINRVFQVVYPEPEDVNFGLNLSAALVLPLPGVWNAIVYIMTSRTACRNLWNTMRGRGPQKRHSKTNDSSKGDFKLERFTRRTSQRERLNSDIISVTSLVHH